MNGILEHDLKSHLYKTTCFRAKEGRPKRANDLAMIEELFSGKKDEIGSVDFQTIEPPQKGGFVILGTLVSISKPLKVSDKITVSPISSVLG